MLKVARIQSLNMDWILHERHASHSTMKFTVEAIAMLIKTSNFVHFSMIQKEHPIYLYIKS